MKAKAGLGKPSCLRRGDSINGSVGVTTSWTSGEGYNFVDVGRAFREVSAEGRRSWANEGAVTQQSGEPRIPRNSVGRRRARDELRGLQARPLFFPPSVKKFSSRAGGMRHTRPIADTN